MSENIRHSHSHPGFERYLRYIFARKYYRCEDCNWRWSRFGLSLAEDKRTILIWILALLLILIVLRFCFSMF